jgi:ribonucleotide monophosphatase NagD (HAD superfamily)
MAEIVFKLTNLTAQDCIIIGDRLYTDIAMGRAAGMDSALVLTGETTLQMLDDADPCARPTYTFESVQGLVKSPPS